jgi:hypothetical protein
VTAVRCSDPAVTARSRRGRELALVAGVITGSAAEHPVPAVVAVARGMSYERTDPKR